jgi:threonine aldolase
MPAIDLRSDTVTRPDRAMYEALCSAPLGDDVLGDDPTARRLEERAADALGKEAALFVPSGTMANSIAIAVLTRPGDEALIEEQAHSLLFEVGGAARLWGVQMVPLGSQNGVVALERLRAAVRPVDIHLPRTRLVVLEQTSNLSGGRILPLEYLRGVRQLTRSLGLGFHLDGARIFNAAVASGVPAKEYADCADTVMFCLSKGLGAPAGSVLVGPKALLDEARRVRKLLGGGMRQAGILAACGLHALENNVARLAEDHANAQRFSRALKTAALPGIQVAEPETNMVYVQVEGAPIELYRKVVEEMKARNVLTLAVLGRALRFVFHKDVSSADTATAAELTAEVLGQVLRPSGR